MEQEQPIREQSFPSPPAIGQSKSTLSPSSTLSTIALKPTQIQVNGTADGGSLFEGIDRGVVMRMSYVLLGLTLCILLYFAIKMYRMKKRSSHTRRYDILSAKQLQPELVVDSESEEDVFDDSQMRLVKDHP